MTSLLESSSSTLDASTSSSSSSTSASYDQWQEWAKNKRRTSRKEAEDLINGECDIDSKTLQHFELPRKQTKRASLIDDDDDDESDSDDVNAPWNVMPRFLAARKALLEEDSDSEDGHDRLLHGSSFNNHHYSTWNNNNCDALFLPPTALRRAKNNAVPRLPSNRSLMATSFSSLSATVTPPPTAFPGTSKDQSFSSCSCTGKSTSAAAAAVSPVPLAIIAAMNSRRRFSVSRQDLLPVV